MEPQNALRIPLALLDRPAFLEELGKSCVEEIKTGSPQGYQQLGYLFIEMMLGRPFPEVDVQDMTPLDSHRVTKIGYYFIQEIVLEKKDFQILPTELEKQTAKFQKYMIHFHAIQFPTVRMAAYCHVLTQLSCLEMYQSQALDFYAKLLALRTDEPIDVASYEKKIEQRFRQLKPQITELATKISAVLAARCSLYEPD